MISYKLYKTCLLTILLFLFGCRPKMLQKATIISENDEVLGSTIRGVVDIAIKDDLLFLSTRANKVFVFDIADPTQPNPITTYSFSEIPKKVVIVDNLAYIILFESAELHILDLSDITTPVEVGAYKSNSQFVFLDMVIDSHYAYISNQRDGLRVIDVSDPTYPREVSHINLPGEWSPRIASLLLTSNYLYVSGSEKITPQGRDGGWIYDISNPAQPQLASNEPFLPHTFYDASLVGNRALFAAGDYLYTVDVSNAGAPQVLGEYTSPTNFLTFLLGTAFFKTGVTQIGDYALLSDLYAFRVIDISTPENPIEVESHKFEQAEDVEVSGNYVFIAEGVGKESGLQIYEFTPQ